MNLSTLFSAYVKAKTRNEFTWHYNFDDVELCKRHARLVYKLEQRITNALQVRETPSPLSCPWCGSYAVTATGAVVEDGLVEYCCDDCENYFDGVNRDAE